MLKTRLASQAAKLALAALFLAACGGAQPALAPVAQATERPTALAPTPVPPTPVPPTPVPPTLEPPTPVPPTAIPPEAMAGLNPSPRGYVSIAYDKESDRVILFGGQTGTYERASSFSGETWAYDVAANTWTQMKPLSGPPNRSAPELAYDAESDRVILVGGGGPEGLVLADTWAYDYNTNTWKEMAKGPKSHLGPRLAYDAESDRVILFGGNTMADKFDDTWAYDFNANVWKEMTPSVSPPARNWHAMAYDSESDRVIVWGGWDTSGRYKIDESVWAYDYNTNTWQEVKPGKDRRPLRRDYNAMVYDAKSDRMILFGGYPAHLGAETWAYDYNTNTWSKLEPSIVPEPLSRHAMVYSSGASRVVLFGGQIGSKAYNFTAETWTYDLRANTWTNVTPRR